MSLTYPGLEHLFGAYLNQDVFEFYPDEFAAAEAFATEDPQRAASAADEIDQLMSHSPEEASLISALDQLGVEIQPVGLSHQAWLAQIAGRVRATLADRSEP